MFATVALAIGSSATLLVSGVTGVAVAEPAPPAPIDGLQAPGLTAVQGISPAIQQAAADPTNAASTLMAAAAVFAGDAVAPTEARNVASAVNQFVAHNPAPGAVPGEQAHLPAGINPAHAVGPVPDAALAADAPPAPAAAPAPAPEAAPVAVAGAPAPEAAPAPAPAPAPEAAPAPAPAPEAAPAPGPAPAPAPAAAPGPAFGPDAPPTQDFMYPSISNGCLGDGGTVLATAISVAGPAKIPTPGPGPGQTAYVFTAVGTPGPAAEQKLPLNVTWVNLTTGKSGSATLKPRSDINPEGPTTLTAIADTGSGSILSTIFGQVTTTERQCQFMPTIGSTVVP
ncbi:conserved alanine and proline rich protein [Mycolicibacterium novocastrense]|nr:conserved alanine and proline rich protein [Mycolicibacterium novocastrense]